MYHFIKKENHISFIQGELHRQLNTPNQEPVMNEFLNNLAVTVNSKYTITYKIIEENCNPTKQMEVYLGK